MNTNTKVVAGRDIAYDAEELSHLRQIIESAPFHCRVIIHPQQRIGIIRIEYEGDSEEGSQATPPQANCQLDHLLRRKGK